MISRRRGLIGAATALIGSLPSCNMLDNNEQLRALVRPSKKDRFITENFELLEQKFPWLGDVRQCVGNVSINIGTIEKGLNFQNFGSAIMIDDNGSALLTYHQLLVAKEMLKRADIDNSTVKPALFTVSESGDTGILPIKIIAYSRFHDVAVAQGDILRALPFAQKKADLYLSDLKQLIGKEVILCGYPSDNRYSVAVAEIPQFPLHASSGLIVKVDEDVIVNSSLQEMPHMVKCTIETTATSISGMSGGGAFVDGQLVGIVSSGADPESIFSKVSSLAPISYGVGIYDHVFSAKKSRDAASLMPSGCKCCFKPEDVEYI